MGNKAKYQIEWCYYCNVMKCCEFKWGRVEDAELNMNILKGFGHIGRCVFKERPKRFLSMTSFSEELLPPY